MTILLKQLFNFFKLLNSDTGEIQLAMRLSFGLVLGFSPFLSLQTFLVLFICFFFRVQLGAAFVSAFFFKFVAFALDPIAHRIGVFVLEQEALKGLFTNLYNMPIVPFTRFNNSIVMGSGVMGFLLVIPAFFVFRYLVVKYRLNVVARFQQSKAWKAWTATTVYQWYQKYDNLYGV
jgi:uncharacterized protein (TIGR03546 family)